MFGWNAQRKTLNARGSAWAGWLLLGLCLLPTAYTPQPASAQQTTLTVLTHESFSLDKKLIAQFEKESGIRLRFLKAGDAGETLNRAILTKAAPVADVLYGFDNSMLSKALAAGILEPYRSPQLANLRSEFVLDQTYRAFPVDYGYVALNYDKAYFKGKPLPQAFTDLARPEFAKLLVVENPATSSPGLAFLLASIAAFGEEGYLGFWEDLRKNGVRVEKGWSEAYNVAFSKNGGDRPLVVSYATSPAAELFYADKKPSEPPTGNLLLPGSSFLQVEFVGILKGSKNRAAARKFVDWLLSKPVQENIPTQMWVYPTRKDAALPEVFKWAEVPKEPARLSPQQIARGAERWVREWTEVVLQGQTADSVKAKR
jgi:thiamine transport system substrate-binding protein